MIISNVTRRDLETALDRTNVTYNGNIEFYKRHSISNTDLRWKVRLCVYDIMGLGVKRGRPMSISNFNFYQPRYPWACFHAHGEFFNHLLTINPKARVRSGYYTYFHKGKSITKDNWEWTPVKIGVGGGRDAIQEWGWSIVEGKRTNVNFNTDFCNCFGDPQFFRRMIEAERVQS